MLSEVRVKNVVQNTNSSSANNDEKKDNENYDIAQNLIKELFESSDSKRSSLDSSNTFSSNDIEPIPNPTSSSEFKPLDASAVQDDGSIASTLLVKRSPQMICSRTPQSNEDDTSSTIIDNYSTDIVPETPPEMMPKKMKRG